MEERVLVIFIMLIDKNGAPSNNKLEDCSRSKTRFESITHVLLSLFHNCHMPNNDV